MGLNTSQATATIAAGAALSAPIFLGVKTVCALTMPAAWDAADITFQASEDGATWYDLLDASGTETKIAAPAATKRLALDPFDFASCVWLKVRSGTSALAVNQSATRTLGIMSRKFYPVLG